MATKIRDNGKLISIFDKVNMVQKRLNQLLPELDHIGILKAMSRCRQYYEKKLYYGRRTSDPNEIKKRQKLQLTPVEKIIYEFLIKEKLNPSTTYRWFLATRLPEDVKERLQKGEIPAKIALKIGANRRRNKTSNQGLLMMEEMNEIIAGL
jgi:hypothetical protein